MATESDWGRDRARFIAEAEHASSENRTPARDHGFPLGPLGQQFATLTYSLLDAQTVADVLDQVVRVAAEFIPMAEFVSVTVRTPDGHFHTPAATDPVAAKLDQLQYDFGEGPCVSAAEPAGPAMSVCADLRNKSPWPRWGPAAADLGVGAVISTTLVPNAAPPRLSGALNIYSRDAHGLDDVDIDQLLLLSTHASLAIAATDAATRAQLKETQLRRAIDSRDVIGQAKGIIMARRGVAADHAFDILRRTSQQLNVKLVELAETLASRHTELDLPLE